MKTPTFRNIALDTYLSEFPEATRRALLKELRATWGTQGNMPSHVLVLSKHPSPLTGKIDELISLLKNMQANAASLYENETATTLVQFEFRERAVLANGSRLSFRDRGCRALFRLAFLRRGFRIADLFRVVELWRVSKDEKVLGKVRPMVSHVNSVLRDCALPLRIVRDLGETHRWLLEATEGLEMRSNLDPSYEAQEAEDDGNADVSGLIEATDGDATLAESYVLLTASRCSKSAGAPERLALLHLRHRLSSELEIRRLARKELAARSSRRPAFWTGASEAIRIHDKAIEHLCEAMARIDDALQGKAATSEEAKFKAALADIKRVGNLQQKGLREKALELVKSSSFLKEVVQSFTSDCRDRMEREIEKIRRENPEWNKTGLDVTGLWSQAEIWISEILQQGFDTSRCTNSGRLRGALKRRLRDRFRRENESHGLSKYDNRLADEFKAVYDETPGALDVEVMRQKGWSRDTYLRAEEAYQTKYGTRDSSLVDELLFPNSEQHFRELDIA
ncbi:MAG: hypothetical protein Q8Q12_15090 [bacterium]|nr:hypothetical protein [bacterium]